MPPNDTPLDDELATSPRAHIVPLVHSLARKQHDAYVGTHLLCDGAVVREAALLGQAVRFKHTAGSPASLKRSGGYVFNTTSAQSTPSSRAA